MLNEEQQEQVEATPLGDDDLRKYFPSAKVITYKELNDYNNLDELLPNEKSFAFLLLESSPNKGHWIALSRYGDEIEVFDSYGGAPDTQIKWNSSKTNKDLGQDGKPLSKLLKGSGKDIVYNPIKYQSNGNDINTCGRHCCYRIQNMKQGKNLDSYYKHMEQLKDNTGLDYDGIVANMIRG